MTAILFTFPDGEYIGPVTPPLALAARAAQQQQQQQMRAPGEPGSPHQGRRRAPLESAGRWQGCKVRVLGSGLEGRVVGCTRDEGRRLVVQHRGVLRPYAKSQLVSLEDA
jgi:hypothetical protein